MMRNIAASTADSEFEKVSCAYACFVTTLIRQIEIDKSYIPARF